MTGPQHSSPWPAEDHGAVGSSGSSASSGGGPGDGDETPEGAGVPLAPPLGGMRFQDPESATPREPSLAERRERERVRREAEVAAWERARQDAEDEEKRAKRRKQLIGGGVAVGLVGALALVYLAASGDDDDDYENAQCVNDQNVVVDDSYCGGNQGGYGPGGLWFFYMGGSRYQYSYGSNAPVGAVANGSSTPSSGKNYATGSGKSVTSDGKTGGPVSRGGFGSKSGSSGSKGSSGSSSGGGKSSGS